MAPSTIDPELAIMNVVGSVAVGAVIASRSHRCQRFAMAVSASDIVVRTVQGESCLSVVIEQPQVPVSYTHLTLPTKA